jgi:hypothetical protein
MERQCRGNTFLKFFYRQIMSRPKTIYSQSEARRLRAQPCIHCGKTSPISRRIQDDAAGSVDPDVAVLWYCPDVLCQGHDGFSIESQ